MNLRPTGTASAVTMVTRLTTITKYHVLLMLIISTVLARSVVDRLSGVGHQGVYRAPRVKVFGCRCLGLVFCRQGSGG
jgi:hypothetical protein